MVFASHSLPQCFSVSKPPMSISGLVQYRSMIDPRKFMQYPTHSPLTVSSRVTMRLEMALLHSLRH